VVAPGFCFQIGACISFAGATPVFIKSAGIAGYSTANLVGLPGHPQPIAVFPEWNHDCTAVFSVFCQCTFKKKVWLAVYFAYIY
jgi:hypothetical protein